MIKLKILSPEELLVEKEVEQVELPGTKGRFVVLKDHAPIISSLTAGRISWTCADGSEDSLETGSGFARVRDNVVIACIER